jgi:hypothetical protein
MSLPTKTLDQLVARAVAHLRTSFKGMPLGQRFFLGREARAFGLLAWGLHKAVEDADVDSVPSSKMSTDRLSDWAFQLGLPDGQGGFGRLLPTPASGGLATLTGVNGTVYADGLTATAEDGTTRVKLSGAQTVPGSPPGFGQVTGANIVAVTPGSVGNLPEGTTLTWDSPPTGADATFALTGPLSKGTDLEDNPGAYARIVARLQTPPRGGVSEDVRVWGTVEGVAQVYVYPRRGGTGTVDAVIAAGGSGQGRVPSTSVLDAAQTSFDAERPVASERVTAIFPYAPNGRGHSVDIRVTPSSGRYSFDWADGGTPMVVASYTPGPPAKITMVGALPAALTNAIDAFLAGSAVAPRVQVLSTGNPVNPGIRAVAYNAGAKTITLETVPSTWTAPTGADLVYAYGPVVATIAAGILALTDSLGPSRASGFGDPITPWRDTLTISGITGVAEDAIDTDGTQLIGEVPVGDATIDGVAADVEGIDDGLSAHGPELLYLTHVAVRAA